MSRPRVLLTGAAGKVGRYVAPQLAAENFEVYGTDLLASSGDKAAMHYRQCDLTQRDRVEALVAWARPDIVLHTAAIVAPISYTCSALARQVNLDASRYLLDCCDRQPRRPHFVFCSSYTVHGPCAPGVSPWHGDTAYAPVDDYGLQKVQAERSVKVYAGNWTILRIGGVFDADVLIPSHRSFKAFAFMVPLAQREHGVDVQDVVAALVGAARVAPRNKVLMIGGDASWQRTAEEIRGDLFAAMGLSAPRPEAYRQVSTEGHGGWYCENWMDTKEAQALLDFQNHSYADFLARVKKKSRMLRWFSPVLRPLIERSLYKGSPYLGADAISSGKSIWDDITRVYQVSDGDLEMPLSEESLGQAL